MQKPGLRLRGAALLVLVLLIPGFAFAGGVEFGVPFYTLDLTETIKEMSKAIPEVDPQDIEEIIENAPAAFFVANFPVPLIGGAIEFPMPIPMIDGLRISGGFLNDQFGKTILAGLGITFPLYLNLEMG
ncbi:MAG: hypothetical protein U9Q23_05365, partial [Candidatus Bipolaricaulota bacterium]|nr:hypothetical protein [Candidatus Bipolaricaulota bacterium]